MYKQNKTLKVMIVALFVVLVCMTAALVVNRLSLEESKTKNITYENEIMSNQQTVYVASEDIEAGEIILAGENVMKQKIYTGLEPEFYITDDELGSTAIIDIKQTTPIISSMVTPITIAKDTREYEISVCNLMVDQKENDYVDIRIVYPNGADMVVLPKKQIKNLDMENQVFWTYLNEEEILRLSSAIIDAFSITGTKIYADRYIESNLQEEAAPTYIVNTVVQDMFDPSSAYYDGNLLTKATQTLNAAARANMEQKLGLLSEEKLAAISSGHQIEDTARNSVLVGASQYDYDKKVEELESTNQLQSDGVKEETAN